MRAQNLLAFRNIDPANEGIIMTSVSFRRFLSAAALCFTPFVLSNAAAEELSIAGNWLAESGDAYIQMKDCGDGTPCGYLMLIGEDAQANAIDDQNPDATLAGRKMHGIKMVWGFKAKGDNWKGGKIYDPNSGKTYKSKMERLSDTELKVSGCVGPFCQGQVWTAYTPVPVKAKDTTISE